MKDWKSGWLRQEFTSAVSIPAATRSNDVIALHGKTIPNPYSGFENLKASTTLAWIQAQEARYQEYTEDPAQRETKESVAALLRVPVKGIPQRMGDQYVFFSKGEGDRLPKLMVSETAEGAGRLLLDPLSFDRSGASEIGGFYPAPDGKFLAYRVGKAGGWEQQVRIRDMETGKDLPDVVPKAASAWWDRDGKGIIYNLMSKDEPSRVILKHHVIGEDPAKDTVFYDGKTRNSFAMPGNSNFRNCTAYAGPEDWLFFTNGSGGNDLRTGLKVRDRDTGAYKTVFDPGQVDVAPITTTEQGTLFWTTHGAPNGRVVLFDPADPQPEKWKTVIPEDKEHPLKHVVAHDGKLVALYGEDLNEKLETFSMNGAPQGRIPMPPLSRIDPPSKAGGEELFFSVTGYTERNVVYRYDAGLNEAAPVDPVRAVPGLENCIIEEAWTTSEDGTKIPMTVVRRADVALDGTAALMLHGYGGFGYGVGPQNFGAEAQDFVKSGGIFVLPHVRGGGEFGLPWHEGGRGENKPNSIGDFIACANFLAEAGYTSAERLVSDGHSNGGMLVLMAMLKSPESFGAVISSCPVADMLSGNIDMMAREYGDPKDPAGFRAAMKISALHHVEPGVKYPPLQLRTAMMDTWLLAGALKFVATMQHDAPDSLALLHVEKDFGHATSRPDDVAAAEIAAKKAFIERSIGPVDQGEFRQVLAAKKIAAPVLSASVS
ncbi:MAG: prolyl oligopeptidase family serine peptidase [Alphaproteobacteria bacterium]